VIQKSEAIVLRTLKYQDTNLIATLYTQQEGIKSCMVKGYRSARARSKHSYFQPLSIIEIVYFEKPNRQLVQIRESKIAYLLQGVQTEPIKLSLGLAIVEIFYLCVKEEEANVPLYEFLRACIIAIDQSESHLIQIFIYYLIHLTSFLGFFPNDKSDGATKVNFSTREGILEAIPNHADAISGLVRDFIYSKLENCQAIRFDQATKRDLIRKVFEYYAFHIEGFQYPKTLKVFTEVFN